MRQEFLFFVISSVISTTTNFPIDYHYLRFFLKTLVVSRPSIAAAAKLEVFAEAFLPPLPCAKPSSEAAAVVALRRANVTDAVHARRKKENTVSQGPGDVVSECGHCNMLFPNTNQCTQTHQSIPVCVHPNSIVKHLVLCKFINHMLMAWLPPIYQLGEPADPS